MIKTTQTHTPGPWRMNGLTSVTTYLTSKGINATVDGIAQIEHKGRNQCLTDEEYFESLKIAEANACLIAAAPDLLQTAKEALGYLKSLPEQYKPDNLWFLPLEQTILKAEERE